MNYKEYISSLNIDSLKIIAGNCNIDYISNANWKSDERDSLVSCLLGIFENITSLDSTIRNLDSQFKELLKIIFFSDEPVDQDDVIRKYNNIYGKSFNVRNLVDILWKKGLVIKFEMFYKNRPYLGLVDEVKPIVATFLADEIRDLEADCFSGSFVSSTPYELSQDIFVFLSYINNNDTKLTIKNVVFKKAAHKIEDSFIGNSDFIERKDEESYSVRFDFINSFLYMINMLSYDNYTILLNNDKVNRWLSLKLSERIVAVDKFLKTFYLGNKREITEAVDKLLMVVLNKGENVIKFDEFLGLIKKYCADMNFSYIQSNVEKIINCLAMIGMVNLYKDSDGCLYFGLNKYGNKFYSGDITAIDEEEDCSFYIQPNFDIISTINLSPKLRWELDYFADLKKLDRTLHYSINKDSVFRALSNGKKLDDILEFLRNYSKTDMPQNIEYTIKEWALGYGSVQFIDTILVRCINPTLALEICSIPEVSSHVVEHITDKDFMVDKRFANDVLSVIVKKGYMANPNISVAVNNDSFVDPLDSLVADIFGDNSKSKNDFLIDESYLDNNVHFKDTVMQLKFFDKEERENSVALKVFSPSFFQAKDIIQKAIDENKPVVIDYIDRDSDVVNKVKLEPSVIEYDNDLWLVRGILQGNNSNVLIDINNIQSIEFSNN